MQYEDILYNAGLPSDIKYFILDKLKPDELIEEVKKRGVNTRDENFISYIKRKIEKDFLDKKSDDTGISDDANKSSGNNESGDDEDDYRNNHDPNSDRNENMNEMYLKILPNSGVIYKKRPDNHNYVEKIKKNYVDLFNKQVYLIFLSRNYDLYLLYRFLTDVRSIFGEMGPNNVSDFDIIDHDFLWKSLDEIFMDIREEEIVKKVGKKKESTLKYIYGDLKYSEEEILALMSVLLCFDLIYQDLQDGIFLTHLDHYRLLENIIDMTFGLEPEYMSYIIVGVQAMKYQRGFAIINDIFKKLVDGDKLPELMSYFTRIE